MRGIISFIVGLYLTVAIVVGGCGAYHFLMGKPVLAHCPPKDLTVRTSATDQGLAGGPDWVPWVLYRAVAWPKAYYDDMNKAHGIVEWLMVEYDPFANC